MICVHCGKEIDNGQDFCPYCGGRVGSDAATEAKAAKKDPRKLALPMVAVALLAVVGVGLANRKPSIDLQRYVTITAQGYDTLGKLDVAFDTDKLEADYGKRIADSFKKAMNDHKESTYGLSSLAQTQPPCAGARSSKRPASMQTVPSVYSAILAPSASCTTTTPDISGNG